MFSTRYKMFLQRKKNETNFTLVFKTEPEFLIKQLKKVSQQVYAIFKFWTFLIK